MNTQLTAAEGRTDEANSVYTPVRMDSPVTAPYAIVTVLFRPFPWEAHNGQSFLTTVESGFLMVLTIRGWRRLRSLIKYIRTEAYIAYAIGVVFAFCSRSPRSRTSGSSPGNDVRSCRSFSC